MTAKSTTSLLKQVKGLHDLHQVRRFLGMSLRELGEHVKPKYRKGPHVSKATIHAWENGRLTPSEDQLKQIIQLIPRKLIARYGRDDIAVLFSHNSPWHITPMYYCYKCRRWHELKAARQTCKR